MNALDTNIVASEWKKYSNPKDPLRNRFVIGRYTLATIGIWDETIGRRVKGQRFSRPLINDLSGFEDGIRIALKYDFGPSNEASYLETQSRKLQRARGKLYRRLYDKYKGIGDKFKYGMNKVYRLDDELDKINIYKRGWQGMGSACKIVFNTDDVGHHSMQSSTIYVRFPINNNKESVDEEYIRFDGKWDHGKAVKQLAQIVRNSGSRNFTMEFSDMGYREFHARRERRFRREAGRREDSEAFLESQTDVVLNHTPLRF